jgi:hypothetical protein
MGVYICLTSALVGVEWSTSRTGRFIPEEIARGAPCIGDWVGPRAGQEDVENRKLFTLQGLELWTRGRQPVSSRYTDYAIQAPLISCTTI